MGFDAYVPCNCYERGLLAIPAAFAPYLYRYVSDYESYLDLNLPYEGNVAIWNDFDIWRDGCCPHPRGRAADTELCSNGGFYWFQHILECVDHKRLSTLLRELPSSPEGMTRPDAAHTCLAELEWFAHEADLGNIVELLDSATGAVILHCYLISFTDYQVYFQGFELGIDAEGFFISHGRPKQILFRAQHFSQTLAQDDNPTNGATFVNLDDGSQWHGLAALGEDKNKTTPQNGPRWHYPTEFHVVTRRFTIDVFAHLINGLRTVFEAAVEFNSPVYWY